MESPWRLRIRSRKVRTHQTLDHPLHLPSSHRPSVTNTTLAQRETLVVVSSSTVSTASVGDVALLKLPLAAMITLVAVLMSTLFAMAIPV